MYYTAVDKYCLGFCTVRDFTGVLSRILYRLGFYKCTVSDSVSSGILLVYCLGFCIVRDFTSALSRILYRPGFY